MHHVRCASSLLLFNLLALALLLPGASPGIVLPPKLLFEKSCQKIFSSAPSAHVTHLQGGCACVRDWKSVKCCCVGEGVRKIPKELAGPGRAKAVSTIFLFDVSIVRLTPATFSAFSNLEDVFLDSSPLLEHVDSRAFAGLKRLRKVHISNCPRLASWSGTMLRDNPKMQTLVVQNCALWELPPLEMTSTQPLPMERIDFSGNCVQRIPTGSVRNVGTNTLSLSDMGHCLRAIDGGAFAGSKFVVLQLSSNPRLSQLSPDAFAGIAHIEHLDLSHTAIASLPFTGLRPLKRLTLQGVPSLKMLPPVLAFPNLVRAEFTYSHHCCFFKYATRDYYERRGGITAEQRELDENFREIQRRVCKSRTAIEQGNREQQEDTGKGEGQTGHRFRRQTRRHVFLHDGSDSLFKELAEWYRNVELQPMKLGNGTHRRQIDEQPEPYSGAELGKSFLLKRCDGAAVDSFYLNLSCSPRPDALNPCEDIVSHWPLRMMIWVMWTGAIFGNIGVWLVIWAAWQRKMRLHYVFMLNLSFADFLTGVYLALLALTDLRTANEYYNYAVEWQTGWGCALAGFLSVFATELSTFSMLMIAAEIYYNSKYSFYGRRVGSFCATGVLLGGYAYSLGMALLPLLGVSSYQRSSICLPLQIQSPLDRAYILLGLSLSALAFLAMVVLYVLLNCMLRNSTNSGSRCPERADEDRTILRRTLVLVGTDMLCWVPTLFFGLTAALGHPLITLSSAKWCLILFYPINSYVFLTRIWRDAKKKAAPLIRRSLANAGGTLSLHKLEKFYTHLPEGRHKRGPMRRRTAGEEEGEEDEEEERPNTIHCCEGGERSILALAMGGQQTLEKGKRRRSSVDGSDLHLSAAPKRKMSPHSQNFCDSVRLSAPQPFAQMRRKSLQPRQKFASPPQLSDISESSTASLGSSGHKLGVEAAENQHKREPKRDKEEKRRASLVVERHAPMAAVADSGKRESNASCSTADGDSGRGDSLRSWARSARPSVASICWEGISSEQSPAKGGRQLGANCQAEPLLGTAHV